MVVRVPLYTRPTQARSQARFDKIIETARAHVNDLGFNDLNIATLAEKAGISVHSVYRYFPDMTAICARFLEEFNNDLEIALDTFFFEDMNKDTWKREVARFIKYFAIHIIERPWIVKTKLICQLDPKLEAYWCRMSLGLEKQVAQWLKTMNFQPSTVSAQEMARFIILQMEALILDIGRTSNSDKMKSMATIRKVILSYLGDHIPTQPKVSV
jgi:AcrR family transcriptional regulator